MNNLNPAGQAFEELTLEEMIASQGSGDVKAQTTYPCIYVSAVESSAACAEALSAVVSATASFVKKKC